MIPQIINSMNTHDELCQFVDCSRPVQVYFNLHTRLFSVRQDKVVCHTDYICLSDVEFKVSQRGRERVLREKRKNVHAYVTGHLVSPDVVNKNTVGQAWLNVTYNPYKFKSFVFEVLDKFKKNYYKPLTSARYADMMVQYDKPNLIAVR
jgi:hypothetical protein